MKEHFADVNGKLCFKYLVQRPIQNDHLRAPQDCQIMALLAVLWRSLRADRQAAIVGVIAPEFNLALSESAQSR